MNYGLFLKRKKVKALWIYNYTKQKILLKLSSIYFLCDLYQRKRELYSPNTDILSFSSLKAENALVLFDKKFGVIKCF